MNVQMWDNTRVGTSDAITNTMHRASGLVLVLPAGGALRSGGTSSMDRICPECGKSCLPRGFRPHVETHRPDPARFWGRVDRRSPDECWPWTGSTNNYGYGRLQWLGKSAGAHRVAYELLVGVIPDGLVIDHLCRNRSCVNPGHMEPVTNAENVMRGEGRNAVNARRVECVNGHPFNERNTFVQRSGFRRCTECRRIRQRASGPARRAAIKARIEGAAA